METDNAHKFVGFRGLFGDDAHLFSEGFTELLISDGQSLLELPFDDGLIKELGESLGDAALHQLRDRLEGVSSVLELLEALELDPTSDEILQLVNTGLVVEVLEDVVHFRQLLLIVAAE